jgi:hypothetical protein
MKQIDHAGMVIRAMEEIQKIQQENPKLSLRDISRGIERNPTFLYDLKGDPSKYRLSISDLFLLNHVYGADDYYIYKGLRQEHIHVRGELLIKYQEATNKLESIRTIVNQ